MCSLKPTQCHGAPSCRAGVPQIKNSKQKEQIEVQLFLPRV